jgi:hypothetical protein
MTTKLLLPALLLSALAAPVSAQHVAVDNCGIVIRETARSEIVRTSEGRVVRLRKKTKTNIVFIKARAGHKIACWVQWPETTER